MQELCLLVLSIEFKGRRNVVLEDWHVWVVHTVLLRAASLHVVFHRVFSCSV